MFTNKMIWQIDEYMLYCQSKRLSEKTMESYEQTLHLFERWCGDEMLIENVTEITEGFIRRYINDLQTRGKYTVCCNDGTKKINCPERRRDFRQPVSVTTIKDYSTDAVLFYPGLSYAFFSVLENNICDISSQIYEVTQQYEVDSVVIMHGYYSEWGDLFKIRNGGIVESIL